MASLPTELILAIAHTAASQCLSTAITLCLVSKWIRHEVEPILHPRVISIRDQDSIEFDKMFRSEKNIAQLEAVAWYKIPGQNIPSLFAFPALIDAKPRPRIRSLMLLDGWGFFKWALTEHSDPVFPFLEELHIHDRCSVILLGSRERHRISRVHIIFPRIPPQGPHKGHKLHPVVYDGPLTHIALTVNIPDPESHQLPLLVRSLLETAAYPSITRLLVRLYFDGESMEPFDVVQQLKYMQASDHRFVLLLFPQGTISNVEVHSEWEHNIKRGGSIWDVPEATNPTAPSS